MLTRILPCTFETWFLLQVIASLAYDDNGAHVEKTSDGEAPLLATHDGIEFASCDRPSKVVQGHASFKLKISQVLR